MVRYVFLVFHSLRQGGDTDSYSPLFQLVSYPPCSAFRVPISALLILHCVVIYQVSGGFATVHPNNKLTINAVEAAPLEHFSPEVRIVLG